MALREQPYLPLYVQDFMTDEKLNECSAESAGVYVPIAENEIPLDFLKEHISVPSVGRKWIWRTRSHDPRPA